jgi:hypothetical protein
MRPPIPLRPDPNALVTRNVTALARAVIAKAACKDRAAQRASRNLASAAA